MSKARLRPKAKFRSIVNLVDSILVFQVFFVATFLLKNNFACEKYYIR